MQGYVPFFPFLNAFFCSIIKQNLKGKVGFIFGGLSLAATIVCFFYIPELRGKTNAEIDTMFQKHVQPRKMGSYHDDEFIS